MHGKFNKKEHAQNVGIRARITIIRKACSSNTYFCYEAVHK